jgi:hypothetical protein
MKLIILTFVLLAFCFAGLGIRIWIKGEFTENEIGRNKNMQKLGIKCVKDEELEQYNSENKICHACSACSFFVSCDKK